MKTSHTALLAIVAAAVLGACGDDDGGTNPPPPAETRMQGTVISVDDLQPFPGAEIFLIDDSTMTIVAGPALSDSFGVYGFDDPPIGTFAPLLISRGQFFFDRSASHVTIVAGDTLVQDFRVFDSDFISTSGGYKVRGVVRDGETKEPIAGASVSMSCCEMHHILQNYVLADEDFTDSRGEYLLESVALVIDETGMPRLIFGFGVSKEGYRVHYSGWLPLPTGDDSTIVVDVDLQKGGPTGAIYGRVLYDGQPVPNILVGLDVVDTALFIFPDESKKGPVLGKVDTTDVNGRYSFSGLTPGFYSVDAAYRIGDGYVVDFDERALRQLTVSAGDSLEVPDSHVKKAIALQLPVARSTVLASEGLLLRWEAIPTADSYRLWLTAGHIFETSTVVRDTNELFLEPPAEPTPNDTANIRWFVEAFRADSTIGTSEEIATFTLIYGTPGK
jgi:hypothetical protein